MGAKLTRKQAVAAGIVVKKSTKGTRSKASAEERAQLCQGRNQVLDAMFKAHGLPTPVHEYAFHPTRKWKFDFLFDGLIALEVEGGIFGHGDPCPTCNRRPPGAHSSIENIKRDIEKYNAAAEFGYVVIRCLPEDLESGAAAALVARVMDARGEQS